MAKMVCPWWLGYWLIIPLRRLMHDPDELLKPYVRPGMRVLDVGPGMGYFSLPMARMVGESGKVICVDLQEKMLAKLRQRAKKAGLAGRIETRKATRDSLNITDLTGTIDFALLFAVAHEVPDQDRLFEELFAALTPGGTLLFAEPTGHVREDAFDKKLLAVEQRGFVIDSRPFIHLSHAAVLIKKA